MTDRQEPTPALTPIHGFRLRRAVLGILLAERRPMEVREVLAVLHAHGVAPATGAKTATGVLANLLGYQVRTGRVRRVTRGRYEVVPWDMSRSTRWRYFHWYRMLDEPERDRSISPRIGPPDAWDWWE